MPAKHSLERGSRPPSTLSLHDAHHPNCSTAEWYVGQIQSACPTYCFLGLTQRGLGPRRPRDTALPTATLFSPAQRRHRTVSDIHTTAAVQYFQIVLPPQGSRSSPSPPSLPHLQRQVIDYGNKISILLPPTQRPDDVCLPSSSRPSQSRLTLL